MEQNNKKEFTEIQESESFLNRKRIFILVIGFLLSFGFFALTILCVLKIDWTSLWNDITHNANIKPFLLTFLILFTFLRPLLNSLTILVRLKKMGFKSSFLQNVLYDFTMVFLWTITPANLVADPYSLFWIKSHGVSNSKSFVLVCSNGMICQAAQVIITIPSFIVVCMSYHAFIAAGTEAISVFWLMVIGLCIDTLSIVFFCAISFSKNLSYLLSLIFNKIKKFFHLKYHTNEQVKERYLNQKQVSREAIELLKDWKCTTLVFLIQLVVEFITYSFMFACIQWIVPVGEKLSFISIFNCANVAVTANKMIPLPGSQVSLEWTLKTTLNVCGKLPKNISDLTNVVNNSILINRFFTSYLPSLVGIGSFIWLTIIQVRKYSRPSKTSKIKR